MKKINKIIIHHIPPDPIARAMANEFTKQTDREIVLMHEPPMPAPIFSSIQLGSGPDPSICCFCGCENPGRLPKKLTPYQIKVAISRFNEIMKQLPDEICRSKQAIYSVLSGQSYGETGRMLSDYFLTKLALENEKLKIKEKKNDNL